MENLAFDMEGLFDEVRDRAEGNGAYSREEWDDIVTEVLDSKREFMELDDDQSWEELKEALCARYDDFAEGIREM